MRKLLLLFSLIFICTSVINCSSDRDNVEIKGELPVNKEIPAELMGAWKINYAMLASDPDFSGGNNQGYYVKVNSDNTIDYYDGNNFKNKYFIMPVEKVDGSSIENGSTVTFFAYQGRQKITCKKSSKYTGQVEFKIIYPSDSPYYNMILIGTKQNKT